MLRIGFLGEAFGGNSAIRALRSEITAQLSQTADVISYAAGDKHIRCDYLIIESSDVFIDHINQLFGEFRAVPPELLGARFIVQFKHDLYSHRGESFKIYCDLLDSYTHYFIHFSKYSQHMFLEKFPQAVHVCVHHPGYQIPAAPASREVLRSNLNISAGTLVFLFFGTSRKYTESEWILDFFRHSGGKRKFLLLSNNILAGNLIQRNLLRFRLIQTSHKMGNSKVKDEDIAALMQTADIGLVPRLSKSTLNSGLPFLYAHFGLPFILPENSILHNTVHPLSYISEKDFNPQHMDLYRAQAEKNRQALSSANFDPGIIAAKIINNIWQSRLSL